MKVEALFHSSGGSGYFALLYVFLKYYVLHLYAWLEPYQYVCSFPRILHMLDHVYGDGFILSQNSYIC